MLCGRALRHFQCSTLTSCKLLIGAAIVIGIVSFSVLRWLTAISYSAPQVMAKSTRAIAASSFLNSIGVNLHVDQGYDPKSYIEPLLYTGIREVRDGSRHISADIMLHEKTGVHFVIYGWDIKLLLKSARDLAKAGALLAIEGPNEPNNFKITFDGKQGGGVDGSWLPVAAFQRTLYKAVRTDPILSRYPVFDPSEVGAEASNVCLQFLVIPPGTRCPYPAGTRFADYANVHNYVSGNGGIFGPNQAWHAASPTLNDRWDGLYGNYGKTWRQHYIGYPINLLASLPRVTTETGWDSKANPGGMTTQAAVLTDTYLSQFARGWSYTFIYEMRDGEGSVGHQGLYDGTNPKAAATYLHNLTSILADHSIINKLSSISFAIKDNSTTVHSLLLQKSDGQFELVVWDERVRGFDKVTIQFGSRKKTIEIFDIAVGTSPVKRLKNVMGVTLDLSNHALILQFR
jgi:hypothetical protein